MLGGEISGNQAKNGGGVYSQGESKMKGGTITGNKSDRGKGVMVRGSSATFDWKNGEITANEGTGNAVVTEGGGNFNAHGHTAS